MAKNSRVVVATVALVGAIGVLGAAAQPPQGMPPLPKPGPEHQVLKEDVGDWDAVVEIFAAPGAPPMKSVGSETSRLGCGGLCLITDFKGDMMGTPFEGHGTTAWNPEKKKYVGSWSDSMSLGLAVMEATWDPATKTLRGTMDGPDADGKTTRMASVTEYKGGARTFTLLATTPDGKETPSMRITYTRKK